MFVENLAYCFHCGKRWITGDCIPSICPECQETGHKEYGFCEKCLGKWQLGEPND